MNNTIIESLRIVVKSGLVFIVLFYPIGIVHETGHYLIGYSSGSQCIFDLVLEVTCSPLLQQDLLYFSFGGILGMITSSALLVIKKLRKTNWIFIGIVTTVFDQLVKSLFETLANQAYLSLAGLAYMLVLVGSFFLVMVIIYPKTHRTT